MNSKNPEPKPHQKDVINFVESELKNKTRPIVTSPMTNNHPEDQASIEAMHKQYVNKLDALHDALNDDLMNFQDDAYALGRSRGMKEGDELCGDMLKALREARDVIATALKTSAPDFFQTDADVAQHYTVAQIDAVIAKANTVPVVDLSDLIEEHARKAGADKS